MLVPRVPLQDAAGCCLMDLEGAVVVRALEWALMPEAPALLRCWLKVVLSERCVRIAACRCRVLLESGAVGVVCSLWCAL